LPYLVCIQGLLASIATNMSYKRGCVCRKRNIREKREKARAVLANQEEDYRRV